MITGIVTFLIIFAVIGSILYGQKLIKTEKSDAVFGNPERAKGGIHWVIVGTSFLLFTWLYYSWDIAKSFYPKSANELCQVAKVNESLLSLKYLFPIEERSHKSTALIKRENINISNKIIVIQNSPSLKNQDKEKFVNLLNKTRQTIPLLTNEKYLETKTKTIINELTNRIKQLTEDFPKDVYPPPLSEEEENKRVEATKKQLGWGATGMEVPPLPESKKGLKFHTAAQELNEISDDFFSMRNHNPEYLKILKEIKDEIKEIEAIVNSEIRANSKATTETMPIKEAEKKGALAFFGDKYGEEVRVLSMGGDFSVELCGGTHVQRTGDIGYFKIITETSISAGVRRIEALTGEAAVNLSQDSHDNLDSLALKLNTSSEEVRDKISQLIDSNKTLKQELDKLRSSSLSATASDMSLESEEIAGLKVIAKKMEGLDSSVLRETADKLRNKEKNSLIVLISIFEDKVPLVIATHKELDQIDARDVMNHLVNLLGGSGGGRSDFAQGGIEKVDDIEIALASLSEFLVSLNS